MQQVKLKRAQHNGKTTNYYNYTQVNMGNNTIHTHPKVGTFCKIIRSSIEKKILKCTKRFCYKSNGRVVAEVGK